MELTILLAKVFGIYLILGGLASIFRRKYFMSALHQWVEHRMLRTVVAAAEVIAGLFLIIQHNIWTSFETGLVSFFGWVLFLEGVLYMFIPDRALSKFINFFNRKMWYTVGGALSVIAGIYLVNFSFALGWF